MSRPDEYLTISEEYVRAFGGLRWCAGGEAVEYAAESPKVGLTFAMSGEIAGFLEGFRSVRAPIAFGYVLHLLHLLRVGARFFGPEAPSDARLVRLAHAYVE